MEKRASYPDRPPIGTNPPNNLLLNFQRDSGVTRDLPVSSRIAVRDREWQLPILQIILARLF
jgi:hypothetical protein